MAAAGVTLSSRIIVLPQGCLHTAEWSSAGVLNLLGWCAGLSRVHVHVCLGPWQYSFALADHRWVLLASDSVGCLYLSRHVSVGA